MTIDVSHEEIEKEAERYVREYPEALEYKLPRRYMEVSCQVHTAPLLSRLAVKGKVWYHSSVLCIPLELLRIMLFILYRLVTEPSTTLHTLSSLFKSIKEDFSRR